MGNKDIKAQRRGLLGISAVAMALSTGCALDGSEDPAEVKVTQDEPAAPSTSATERAQFLQGAIITQYGKPAPTSSIGAPVIVPAYPTIHNSDGC